MKIQTLLVANRGEIACRIIRTARALGIDSVAVHSDIDAGALHAELADRAISLGGSRPEGSYLAADKVLAAARASGAQAVHPGYGFLSENAAFARAVEAAGLLFIGPPASAIEAMGSKSAAKALMEKAQVPLVPGYHGDDQRLEAFTEAAERIGYPVLLKAAAGGGGKGMKVVEQQAQLAEALASAQREAQAAFGDARMLVEKYLLGPRHVEIQVFADQHGHCLYLHERDCSIQRRHQKVVEEAPAPGLSPAVRQAMGEAAVKAAQAIGYVGAGTVEFLLDERGEFFFMEMNTRLQVEHPVTEAITGLDLVAWQLRVAQGEPLPMTQDQVPLNGHAIEVRLYAEDTERGFLPAAGPLRLYREPAPGDGRRVDSGVREGDEVSPFYDPMLAKVIAWGENREQARQRLLAMLGEMAVGGFASNLGFVRRVIAHPAFAAAQLDTRFIARHEQQLLVGSDPLPEDFWALAAEAWLSQAGAVPAVGPWAECSGWRLNAPAYRSLALRCGEQVQRVCLSGPPKAMLRGERIGFQQGGPQHACRFYLRDEALFLEWNGSFQEVRLAPPETGSHQAAAGGLAAPMNASVAAVFARVGEAVQVGATLLVLEAMKMEHPIRAPQAGIVAGVYCREGDLVTEGHLLVGLEPAP